MSADQPPPNTPAELDLDGAMRLVESALADAGVATTERERLACAKTLLRLVPRTSVQAGAEDFAAVLRELDRA